MTQNLSIKSKKRIEVSNRIFDLLTTSMNEIHHRSLSSRFCRIFLENHVRAVVNKKNKLDTRVRYDLSPHPLTINVPLSESMKRKARDLLVRYAKHFITRTNPSKRIERIKSFDHLSTGFSNLPDEMISKRHAELQPFHPIFWSRGNSDKRKHLNEFAESQNDVFENNIIRLMPRIAVEHFENVMDQIKLIRPEDKTFHIHVLGLLIYDSFFIAKYVENGSKLVWYQDGAECAEWTTKYGRYYHHSVADQYRTWGWKMTEKDVRWKAGRLMNFEEEYLKYEKRSDFQLLLIFPKINRNNRKLYKERVKFLLEHLSDIKKSGILARPYPVNPGRSSKGQLDFVKDERMEVSTAVPSVAEEISKSDVVVQMEVPSTNFLECIYVDKPTIGILDNTHPTEIIKPYYDFFLKKDILHTDIQSLADHLNSVEYNKWWEELVEDPKMAEYKQTFAGMGTLN